MGFKDRIDETTTGNNIGSLFVNPHGRVKAFQFAGNYGVVVVSLFGARVLMSPGWVAIHKQPCIMVAVFGQESMTNILGCVARRFGTDFIYLPGPFAGYLPDRTGHVRVYVEVERNVKRQFLIVHRLNNLL